MTLNASVKGNLVYVSNEALKDLLMQKGFQPLHITHVNKKKTWVFEKNREMIGLLNFSKPNSDVVIDNKLNFIV